MHITLVSRCEKRAIKRTRSILDRYASRTGDTTWSTPITKEALDEVKVALKRKATRQTAVACFINRGTRSMRLAWIVGNKNAFGANGEVPISTRAGTLEKENKWLSDAVMLASTAGLLHDLGKMSKEFSDKITPEKASQKIADPIRHELISALIVKKMLAGATWEDSWPRGEMSSGTKIGEILLENVDSAENALLYLISTHHLLFGKGTVELHVRSDHPISAVKGSRSDADIKRIAEAALIKFKAHFRDSQAIHSKWFGLSIYARAALILADQKGSSDESKPAGAGDATTFYANTTRNNGKSVYNQTLGGHLALIASEAKKIARGMARSPISPLSDQSKQNLLKKATIEFDWQNRAARALTPGCPTLILNIAATGAGKTRMNMRSLAVLAKDAPMAVTTSLGLRTLTLQTGDAYKEKDGLALLDDEVAVVIGCAATRALHEYEKDDIDDMQYKKGGEPAEMDLFADAVGQERVIPEYLSGFAMAERSSAILSAPVLVSTIDYVISAGDPSKKAAHGISLLRLMHSDLIIDEIDGFEPKALSAILRIVKISAMFGRNVVASSGTLPEVIAQYLAKAYSSGIQIYDGMNDCHTDFDIAIIDDSLEPVIMTSPSNASFADSYRDHLFALQDALKDKAVTKQAFLIETEKNESVIKDAILLAADRLHEDHSWMTSGGSRASIGLVRIANIRNAIEVARMLSKRPDTHVVCYHARHFMMQRSHIEKKLDKLLSRKKDRLDASGRNHWLERFESDEDIAKINGGQDLKIVVVATPVEEVGRDHDFDWAIIEPSSTQSIVQTAGRVNRHRKAAITRSNVGILQFNFRAGNGESPAFCKPGYESEKRSHQLNNGRTTYDVADLIDFKKISERLDSSLRFDEACHTFSRLDSASIKDSLARYADFFIDERPEWLRGNKYREAALRDHDMRDEFYYDGHDFRQKMTDEHGRVLSSSAGISRSSEWKRDFTGKMLFGLSPEQMLAAASLVKPAIDIKTAMAIHCYPLSEKYSGKHEMTAFGCIK